MNRKQRRANKVKPFQSLGKNMVALPNTAVLNSDAQFEDQGYVKVRFPVNETSRQKGIGSERMWVKITEGDKISIKNLMKEYENIRNKTQPQKVNCCGSIFKNPKNQSAWKLIKSSIDESFYNGPIKLSKIHSNFFENEPNISAKSIELFISNIQKRVREKHKITLEKELRIKV